MKLIHHKDLTVGKWRALSLAEQMANVGSEVIRTINWKNTEPSQSDLAFERSLELFDLTKEVVTTLPRRREIARLRELWVDFIKGDNSYQTTQTIWESEFISYTFLARNTK